MVTAWLTGAISGEDGMATTVAAQKYRDQHRELLAQIVAFRSHLKVSCLAKIQEAPADFIKQSHELFYFLAHRIQRENTGLYPMVGRMAAT
jgi:hypothetical protein